MFGKKEKTKRIKVSKESKKTASKIFSFITPYKGYAITGGVFLILSSVLSTTFPPLIGILMGNTNFQGGLQMNSDSFKSIQDLNINTVAVLLIASFILQAIFSFGRIYFFSQVTEGALKDLRKSAFEKLITSPLSYFNKNKVGELTSRIATDINLLQETFNTTIAELIRQVIIVAAMLTYITYISGSLALRMLAVIPPVIIAAVLFGKYIKSLSKQAQDSAAESNSILEEALTGIVNVKAFTNELFEINQYSKAIQNIKKLSIKSAIGRGAFVSFIILCMFGAIVFVIWSGLNMVKTNAISSGDFYSFMMCTVFLAASIGSLPDLYAKYQKAIGSSENLMIILDNETEESLSPEKSIRLNGEISFQDICFHYDGRKEVEVLKNISFDLQTGETIALVGSSGSGKSTIASLLLQFYPINSGNILFDGKKASSYHLSDLRSNMAYVPQEVILFGGTIKENIAYGNLDATEDQITEAAKKANALEFISSFPDGFETVVGDRGIQLSGGQRQRIAIARAILKNPSILILDEATSALDTESEKLVQDALDKLMKGRTSLVIAHRLSTIKNADQIIVLDKGEIVEKGNHQELIKNPEGAYYRLNQNQFDQVSS